MFSLFEKGVVCLENILKGEFNFVMILVRMYTKCYLVCFEICLEKSEVQKSF